MLNCRGLGVEPQAVFFIVYQLNTVPVLFIGS